MATKRSASLINLSADSDVSLPKMSFSDADSLHGTELAILGHERAAVMGIVIGSRRRWASREIGLLD